VGLAACLVSGAACFAPLDSGLSFGFVVWPRGGVPGGHGPGACFFLGHGVRAAWGDLPLRVESSGAVGRDVVDPFRLGAVEVALSDGFPFWCSGHAHRRSLRCVGRIGGKRPTSSDSDGVYHPYLAICAILPIEGGSLAVTPRQIEHYMLLRREGWSISAAARECGFSRSKAHELEKKNLNGQDYHTAAAEAELRRPQQVDELCGEARRALDDFGFWRHRYLGRDSTPWQEEAAERILGWLDSPLTEFVDENCPPGSGKTTKWTDICAWLICRNRGIRIIWLSHTIRLSSQATHRVRKILERPMPVVGAQGCLAVDYGRFRPEGQGLWTKEEFSVVGLDDLWGEEKEPTLAAYGMESEFLGHRADLVIGDDLQTNKLLRTMETIETTRKWWMEEGETRVEPGGVVVLVGQRMGPEDLYRFSLNQTMGGEGNEPRYRQIIYRAHDEENCKNEHGLDAPPFPAGCLLDPVRLPWEGAGGLVAKMTNRAEVYRVQYQQEDVDPSAVLVPKIWVSGGRDVDGTEYPGCWDSHRRLCELPKGLSQPYYSIATADPSPTKMWAIEWWIYHPASEQRFLMDLERCAMDASDFLDWNENDKQFFGVAEDWQVRSKRLGVPITHWIVENNAAQRFLLQYDHTKRWVRQHSVTLMGHSTTLNKLDPAYGLQSVANRFKFGNVRLPGNNQRDELGMKDPGRYAAMKLVDEATKYATDGSYKGTDDCLMAFWFLEFNLPHIAKPERELPLLPRPQFVRT
jgi:hypothetical protein